MKKPVPKSVDEYIAAQPEVMRPKLEQVRTAIKRAVPEAQEGIGYGMPGYKLHGKPMLYFAGFKEHYSLFAASGTFFAAVEDELRGYDLRKGTIHFTLAKAVPVKLIRRIAELRAAGIAATPKKPEPGREKARRNVGTVGDRVLSQREAVGCNPVAARMPSLAQFPTLLTVRTQFVNYTHRGPTGAALRINFSRWGGALSVCAEFLASRNFLGDGMLAQCKT
jgi:uncharacterized protein YdhG (YjbR/CyaY superfamily)